MKDPATLKRDVNNLSTQEARWEVNLGTSRPFYFITKEAAAAVE